MFCFLTTTQQDLIVSFTHYLTTLEPNLLWQDITQTFPYPDNDHCHCYADHVVKNAYTGSCKCLRGLQSRDNFRSSSSRSLRFGYLPRSCGDSPPPPTKTNALDDSAVARELLKSPPCCNHCHILFLSFCSSSCRSRSPARFCMLSAGCHSHFLILCRCFH